MKREGPFTASRACQGSGGTHHIWQETTLTMPFDEILGQDRVLRGLRNALSTRNTHHAYLFYGTEGTGRFKTALAFARAFFCQNADADFCGVCGDCTRVAAEAHPDLLVVRPESKRGEKEWHVDMERGNLRIEQVRELQRWLAVRSYGEVGRLAILEGAERMNSYAANALLKTLEEPPPGALLILVSPSRARLPATIVSRCQAVYFSPIQRQDMERILREHVEDPSQDLSLLASLAGGSVGKALQMDGEWVFRERKQWLDRLIAFMADGPEDSLAGFVEALSHADRMTDILHLFLTWYRDLLVVTATGDTERVLNRDCIDEMMEASSGTEPGEWVARIEAVRQAQDALGGAFNLNAQMVLEALMLRLSSPYGKDPVRL